MDRITQGFLSEFSSLRGLSKLNETDQFEHFANFCALTADVGDVDIDIQDMYTGEAAQGIDGIAIVVNGNIVSHIDDVQMMINQNRSLNVKFVFVQAKTSEKFQNGEIANFISFVESFFSDTAKSIFNNAEMKSFIEIKDFIYDNSKYMKIANPCLNLYYVALGKWDEQDINLKTIVNTHVDSLIKTNLFSNVSFFPCDTQKIQNLYRKSQQQLTASFDFEKNMTMFSNINNEYGYSGVLPFREFKKIICDEYGCLKKVFEDNIRDFLGSKNTVNEDIENTLLNDEHNSFCMFNNGITVVAHSANLVGIRMTIENYQIVNGCQTSHILFLNKDNPKIDSLLIPIKIIVTENEELKNRITKATNNQSSIKKEQLEALSSYQKTLEEYYKTFQKGTDGLYYERRSGQYRNESIPKPQIVTIRSQIKNASAMFLNKPHDASGHYSVLLKDVGAKIFKIDDKASMYYASSLAVYKYESLIKSKTIDKKYSKGKYHAVMLLKYLFGSDVPKYHNAKKMDVFCNRIIKALNDDDKCVELFLRIIKYFEKQNALDINDRKLFERKETTDILLKNVNML